MKNNEYYIGKVAYELTIQNELEFQNYLDDIRGQYNELTNLISEDPNPLAPYVIRFYSNRNPKWFLQAKPAIRLTSRKFLPIVTEFSPVSRDSNGHRTESNNVERASKLFNTWTTRVLTTHRNLKMEMTTNSIKTDDDNLDIFLSHSSKDVDLVEAVVNLLEKAIGIDPSKIRCTSLDGYSLDDGVRTSEKLREEIKTSKLLIGLISSNSIGSQYVLFELGARWGYDLPIIPICIDSLNHNNINAPIKELNIRDISKPAAIHKFLRTTAKKLDMDLRAAEIYEGYLNKITHLISQNKAMPDKGGIIAKEELSEDQLDILKHAVNDPSGVIRKVESKDGLQYITGSKSFCNSNHGRHTQKWKSIIEDLLEMKLIETEFTSTLKGNPRYLVTNKGFELYDSITKGK